MNDNTRYSIGELARRTGLTVKAVRFYADLGIVPPADRSPAGYRRFDVDAVARLDLVRTLRELGLDLTTIRKVVDREVSLSEVAATHAEALATQIRVLRQRRAVLTAVAARGATPQETALLHRLARLSERERRQLIDDFLASAFAGLESDGAFVGIMRSLTPHLPDDPEAAQVAAWVELAELAAEPGFRASIRRMAEQFAADRAASGDAVIRRDAAALAAAYAGPALEAGIDPGSPQADAAVTAVTARYAELCRSSDDLGLRRRLLTRLEAASDPRRERYVTLLSVINGWPAPSRLTPVFEWLIQALRVRMA
jgi:DNA-binding transcriptional MerR regulator